MEIVSSNLRVNEVRYFLVFYYKTDALSGFRFECDRKGFVDTDKLPPLAKENLQRCMDKDLNVLDPVLEKDTESYFQYPIARCACGQEIVLDNDHLICPSCHKAVAA